MHVAIQNVTLKCNWQVVERPVLGETQPILVMHSLALNRFLSLFLFPFDVPFSGVVDNQMLSTGNTLILVPITSGTCNRMVTL